MNTNYILASVLIFLVVINVQDVAASSSSDEKSTIPTITLQDMRKKIDWSNRREIGKGGFGIVYKVSRNSDGQVGALKKVPRYKVRGSTEGLNMLMSEVDIQKEVLNHPNIAKVFSVAYASDLWSYIILMEYIEGLDLFALINECGTSVSNKMKSKAIEVSVIAQLFSALKHLKESQVMHRDIKPENIMVSTEGQIKLIDFGHAVNSLSGRQTRVGTKGFKAPEIESGKYDWKIDWFSTGLTILEMMTGYDNRKDNLDNKLKELGETDSTLGEIVGGLVNPDLTLRESGIEHAVKWLKSVGRQPLMKNPKLGLAVSECMKKKPVADAA